jgi:hypothetical protein
MSRRIAKLLDESEAELSKLLADLEKKNGLPSHDARHIADVHQRVRSKLADLNLDPDDTTAPELYHALLIRFETDCRKFDEVYGTAAADFDHKTATAAKLLEDSARQPRLWALKNKAAKELLSAHAPKQVMKFLGYRSAASLLKREDISEIFIVAQVLESDSWQKQQARLASKLQPTAFELRELKLTALSYDRWNTVDFENDVIVSDEMGAVAVWPSDQAAQAPLLSISLLLIEELRKYDRPQLAAADIFAKDKTLVWWSDMDHLVADLRGGQVSMNLHDVAGNWLGSRAFDERSLQKGRHNYWRQLIDKYEHKGDIEALFDDSVLQKVQQLKFNVPQPAFEYDFAEDF